MKIYKEGLCMVIDGDGDFILQRGPKPAIEVSGVSNVELRNFWFFGIYSWRGKLSTSLYILKRIWLGEKTTNG